MKYNNSDMDDLFRRASEGYPLRTDSADWDRLAGELDGEPPLPSDQEGRRRRRGIFWWFLVIPLMGIGYLTWQMGVRHAAEKGIAAAPDGKSVLTQPGGSGEGPGGNRVDGNAGSTEKRGSRTDAMDKTRSGAQGSVAPAGETGEQSGDGAAQADEPGGGSRNEAARTGEPGGQSAVGTARTSNRRVRAVGRSAPIGGAAQNAAALNGGVEDATVQDGRKHLTTRSATGEKVMPHRDADGDLARAGGSGATLADPNHLLVLAALDLRRAPVGGRYRIDVPVVASAGPGGSATTGGATPIKNKSHENNAHGYIGVTGAPDFSMIRFQSMKGVGTTFGLLLGYSFNDRWAVESGLYLDRKRYYTAGEYFNTKGVHMPPNATLLDVDGTCYMWEIPVNVRYNFTPSGRMKWFATAGLSTYLMSRENYTYQYDSGWGTGESNWNIHKPSQYWFSIVNLSAGLEQRAGKIGNLRIEPYVRIPLSGIGTGKLPILSTGLNIGITRQLW